MVWQEALDDPCLWWRARGNPSGPFGADESADVVQLFTGWKMDSVRGEQRDDLCCGCPWRRTATGRPRTTSGVERRWPPHHVFQRPAGPELVAVGNGLFGNAGECCRATARCDNWPRPRPSFISVP